MAAEEWMTEEKVEDYLSWVGRSPRRTEGEAALLEQIPPGAERVLDVGTGDGRLLGMLRRDRPRLRGVGLDASPPMLAAARRRFAGERGIELVEHDLDEPLPALGRFDAVVSGMAIHHLEDERKRSLYAELFDLLEPGGVFANFEHVASSTPRLHLAFFEAIGVPIEEEDPSDRLVPVETQAAWLREIGFEDADCYWKWMEMALLVGVKPAQRCADDVRGPGGDQAAS